MDIGNVDDMDRNMRFPPPSRPPGLLHTRSCAPTLAARSHIPRIPQCGCRLDRTTCGSIPQPLSRTNTRNRRDREFDRGLWILSKKLTGIYFQTEDFALFCCAL
jgi:hypothetical protein